MRERWLPVVGYESHYEVSNRGRVRNLKTTRLKKPTPNKVDGRLYMLLWKENKYRLFKVHRLVLFAFVGPPPTGYQSCHNDGNPSHNWIENLRWDTASNNQRDRVKHGTSNRGERCAAAKLTEKDVHSILKDNRQQRLIAEQYGVRQSAISRIKSGRRWGHVQEP